MILDMQEMTIYKKDARFLLSGKTSPRQLATFLSGNKKHTKIFVSGFGNIKINELIGKTFFAKITKVNETNYIIEYVLKK